MAETSDKISQIRTTTLGASGKSYWVILDGGNTTFWLVGKETLARYKRHLIQTYGFTESEVSETKATNKSFKFGNNQVLQSDHMAVVPAGILGKSVKLHIYVVPGKTPFLCGRKAMEALGLVIDFGKNKMCANHDRTWRDIPRSDKGHMLINLCDVPRLRLSLIHI